MGSFCILEGDLALVKLKAPITNPAATVIDEGDFDEARRPHRVNSLGLSKLHRLACDCKRAVSRRVLGVVCGARL